MSTSFTDPAKPGDESWPVIVPVNDIECSTKPAVIVDHRPGGVHVHAEYTPQTQRTAVLMRVNFFVIVALVVAGFAICLWLMTKGLGMWSFAVIPTIVVLCFLDVILMMVVGRQVDAKHPASSQGSHDEPDKLD